MRALLIATAFLASTALAGEPHHSSHHGASNSGEFQPAPTNAKIRIVKPKNQAVLPREFTVKFHVEGLKVHAEGELLTHAGHFHLLVDTDPVEEGQPIPAGDKYLHFRKGETSTKVKLKPGKHKLTLQFADGAHRSYGTRLSDSIEVTVK